MLVVFFYGAGSMRVVAPRIIGPFDDSEQAGSYLIEQGYHNDVRDTSFWQKSDSHPTEHFARIVTLLRHDEDRYLDEYDIIEGETEVVVDNLDGYFTFSIVKWPKRRIGMKGVIYRAEYPPYYSVKFDDEIISIFHLSELRRPK